MAKEVTAVHAKGAKGYTKNRKDFYCIAFGAKKVSDISATHKQGLNVRHLCPQQSHYQIFKFSAALCAAFSLRPSREPLLKINRIVKMKFGLL